jgi:hypothetical protein
MADVSSIIITIFFGISEISAPIYASFVESKFSFQITCDIVAVSSLVLGLLYMITSDGISSIYRSFKNIC